MASIPSSERKAEDLMHLTFDDVKHLLIGESQSRPSLGFRFGSQ
jgi:hypothetical protein